MNHGAEVAQIFCEAYNAHDVAAVIRLYAPEARHVEVAQGRVAEGPDAIRHGLETFLKSFPDARWEPDAVIASDPGAAIPYTLTGSLQEALGPFAAQGQQLALSGVHILQLTGSQIVESRDYWDSGSFARQMKIV